MQQASLLLGLSSIACVQAQTFTLSACVTQSGVVNCLRQGSTIPWTTITSQVASATAAPSTTQAGASSMPTVISGCHMHDTAQFCFAGTAEFEVLTTATRTEELPSQYTGCHSHGTEMFCFDSTGEEVEVVAEGESHDDHDHESGSSGGTASPNVTSATSTATAAAASSVTALTGCHMHETQQFCMGPSSAEYLMKTSATATQDLPAQYTGCHNHGSQLFCLSPSGGEVLAQTQTADGEESTDEVSADGISCHFHAGVEHCVDENGNTVESTCEAVDRNYNIPLRIGLVFAILATSSIGVFGPIFLSMASKIKTGGIAMCVVKQFGTGVIISTALVHLFTHAELMFANNCLGGLKYEATTAAIVMAGIFISFVPEYIGSRIFLSKVAKHARAGSGSSPSPDAEPHGDMKVADSSEAVVGHHHMHVGDVQDESPALQKIKVNIMEAGIIFHSLLIGLTLVVAGDSGFITLFIVIIFHQMFEGLALGSRIGDLKVRFVEKILMATAFALITPIGMAIGIGVLNQFNGNDPSTIIAIGTLDALSAGILIYVGLVEMLAHDWMHGELARAPLKQTIPAGISLVAGVILMSVLGKWA